MTESILVKIPLEKLTEELVGKLDYLCSQAKGTHKIRFLLIDSVNREKLKMVSKHYTIEVDTEFISEIEKLGLKYKVNA